MEKEQVEEVIDYARRAAMHLLSKKHEMYPIAIGLDPNGRILPPKRWSR